MKTRLTALVSVLLGFAVLLSACQPQPTVLTGAERDTVLAYSESITDNILQGLNTNDYAAFSRDFDAAMLTGVPESGFNDLKKSVAEKDGQYLSREITGVSELDGNIIINYALKFEQEEGVSFRVVLSKAEPHKVVGLWITSPKLAGK